MKDKALEAPAAGSALPHPPKGLEFVERFLRWVSYGDAYYTPVDDFQAGLGALWLSFCFDHDVNPFTALHEIIDSGFPFKAALDCDVPEWLTSAASAPQAPAKAFTEGGEVSEPSSTAAPGSHGADRNAPPSAICSVCHLREATCAVGKGGITGSVQLCFECWKQEWGDLSDDGMDDDGN